MITSVIEMGMEWVEIWVLNGFGITIGDFNGDFIGINLDFQETSTTRCLDK